MKLKRIALISFATICCIGSIIGVAKYNHKVKVRGIMSQADTRLSSYDYAKSLAKDSLDILTIHDQESYDNAKKKLSKIFSDDLKEEYFLSEKYEGPEINYSLDIMTLRGDEISKKEYVFKGDIELIQDNEVVCVRMLISIKNNIVVNIESLGVE